LTEVSPIKTRPNAPLRFAHDAEAAYRQSVAPRIVQILRFGGIAGMIAVPAFTVNDLLFDPNALSRTLPVRLAVAALIGLALIAFRFRCVTGSPRAIAAITYGLFASFSVALVLIQAWHTNGFLVTVPGYVQVMIFVPIVCFSFRQSVITTLSMALIGVVGAYAFGADGVALRNLLNWLAGSAAFALGAAYVVDGARRTSYLLERDLSQEKARADALLLNILPEKIAERLKQDETRIADTCPCATVLFADIAGFTAFARGLQPGEVVDLLNDLFSRFDRLAEQHGVEKIKTIGDGYMAVAGLNQRRDAAEAATAVASLALDMQDAFATFRAAHGLDLGLRIGVHSGPVVAGVIGVRKFAFDLWGDTVNIASRLETTCPKDAIQISAETAELIDGGFACTRQGVTELPGHAARQTFLLRRA
jgi:class 3 adenylate cyclase